MALLYSALSLEYCMDDMYSIYEVEKGNSLNWMESFTQLQEWSCEESFEMGLRAYELETWGDELIVEDLKPIADKLVEENQILGGKLAFLVIAFCYVLEAYRKLPNTLGNEQVSVLLSELKVYLRERWQTDLESGIINPELNDFHIPMAKEFAQRWKDRLELHVGEAS